LRLLLATHQLGRGGSESYLIAVASELQRLGHAVTVQAVVSGPAAERLGALGVAVEIGEEPSAQRPDGALTQDAGRAFALAKAYPGLPLVFIAHSELFDAQLPPQESGLLAAVVVMNDRVEQRVRVLATAPPIVRLCQPIDTERFAARETIRSRPARALALSNYIRGERLALLRAAWEPAGVEVLAAGEEAVPTDAPELLIGDVDIVVGKGRALLEGMSCARAAYLFDSAGCDGWVTPDSYPALEADAFAGQATGRACTPAVLAADLADYDPGMGTANRDLVTARHGTRRHVQRLVELLDGATAAVTDGAPEPERLDELDRLVRAQWRLEDRATGLARENDRLHARILELEQDGERLRETRRYRLAGALARPLDTLRGERE
jgi:hypothetical protein